MASRNQGSAPRALVVEDIKVDSMILMRMLHKLNCKATAVENGKEAVDLFVEGKSFDIVLLDKDMPIMSGPEVWCIFQIYICFRLFFCNHCSQVSPQVIENRYLLAFHQLTNINYQLFHLSYCVTV